MKNAPAFQFYARDWLADTDVRIMTHKQRGLYIDLLAFCWERGGLPTDESAIARLAGMQKKEFELAWTAIKSKFIAVQGVLVNLKLEEQREFQRQKRIKAQESVAHRWEKSNEPNTNDDTNVLRPLYEQPYETHTRARAPVAVAVEVCSSSSFLEEEKVAKWNPMESFQKFYEAYPKHVGKAAAEKAWRSKVKDQALADKILDVVGVRNTHPKGWPDDKQYIPHPATWLNQGRWEDEWQTAAGNGSKPANRTVAQYETEGNDVRANQDEEYLSAGRSAFMELVKRAQSTEGEEDADF